MKLHLVATLLALSACGQSSEPQVKPFAGIITPPSPAFTPTLFAATFPGTSIGSAPKWDGSTWLSATTFNDPSTVQTWREEFATGTNCTTLGIMGMGGQASGTSTCTYNNPDTVRPDSVALTASTGATDGIRMNRGVNTAVFGTVPKCVTWLVKVPPALSDANTKYIIRGGYNEPAGQADSADAIQFVYDWAANGNVQKWQLETRSNTGTPTFSFCAAPNASAGDISGGLWYNMSICVDATLPTVSLFINNVLCVTQAGGASVPVGTARGTAVGFQLFQNSGAAPAAQLAFVDAVWETVPFSVAR